LSYTSGALSVRLFIVGLLALAIYISTKTLFDGVFSNLHFFYFLTMALFSLMIWRFTYARLSQAFVSPHRVLIIGLGKRSASIASLLNQHATHLNYLVLGYVSDASEPVESLYDSGLPVVGHVSQLPALVQQYNVHEIVVAIEQLLSKDIFRCLVVCQAQGVKVTWMPDLYEKLGLCIPIEHIDPIWALCAIQNQPIFSRLQLTSKRLLDLTIILLALPSFILLLPLLAIAIRIDSPGPIFYRQIRCGRGGKNFSILKFRTMIALAEKDGKPRWASKNDPRITRVGRFMRKTRLDELPQIINILKGDMSVVGPRPERPELIEELQKVVPFYEVRLLVKPGLTGWAQVHYEYGNTVEDALIKLQYDFYYIRYWSLWLDLYTMFKTLDVVFKCKGM
jgi:exopolysaccharide biosynthesis polyprenyl glycosylphosphotransferase